MLQNNGDDFTAEEKEKIQKQVQKHIDVVKQYIAEHKSSYDKFMDSLSKNDKQKYKQILNELDPNYL